MNHASKVVGGCFITGFGAGFGLGCISGLANNIDEYPLVRLNQTLNRGQKYGEQLGYRAAMSSTLFLGSRSLVGKKIDNKIVTNAIGGGVAGAFLGSSFSAKGAIGGGIAGSFAGALYGYYLEKEE